MAAKKKIFLIIFFLIILTFWLFYFLNRELFEMKTLFIYLEIIQDYISNNFFISFVLFTLSYCLLIICNFPAASLLSLIGGFLYGTWIGGIGIIIGGTIGAFIVFLVAKVFFYDFISKKLLNKYSFIDNYFQKNDLLILNNTKVFPAKLFATKDRTDAKVEIFLLRELGDRLWEVLVKPARKVRIGNKLILSDSLFCDVIDNTVSGGRVVRFEFDKGNFDKIIIL